MGLNVALHPVLADAYNLGSAAREQIPRKV
jgi:hypothetical protein